MVHDVHVRHHQHLRVRKKRGMKKEGKDVKFVDKLVYLVGFLGLVFTIPQILLVWVEQNGSGVSVLSWGSYFVGSLIMVLYGYVHREKPIMITYFVWSLFYLAVVVGGIIYR